MSDIFFMRNCAVLGLCDIWRPKSRLRIADSGDTLRSQSKQTGHHDQTRPQEFGDIHSYPGHGSRALRTPESEKGYFSKENWSYHSSETRLGFLLLSNYLNLAQDSKLLK
jgi:hypothetical protein